MHIRYVSDMYFQKNSFTPKCTHAILIKKSQTKQKEKKNTQKTKTNQTKNSNQTKTLML